jgi:hypothetical protein
MRGMIFMLLAVILIASNIGIGRNNSKMTDPVSTWKFEAPAAEDGYNSGNIIIGAEKNKYTVVISFTNYAPDITAGDVKIVNYTLSFDVPLEGEFVTVTLKSERKNKMTGKAVYSGGIVPLTLTFIVDSGKAGTK